MAEVQRLGVDSAALTRVQWTAVALAVLTGAIHVYVGIVRSRPSLLLAGLGFVGGLVLFLANYRRRLLYLTGTVYVVVQIALWVIFNAGEFTPIGFVDKAVQLVLVGLLVYLYASASRTTPEA